MSEKRKIKEREKEREKRKLSLYSSLLSMIGKHMCELFNRQFDFQRETEKTVSSFYLDCFFLNFCDEPTKRFFIWNLFQTISADKGTLKTFINYCDIQKSKINNVIKVIFLNWKLTHFADNRILNIVVNWVITNNLSCF